MHLTFFKKFLLGIPQTRNDALLFVLIVQWLQLCVNLLVFCIQTVNNKKQISINYAREKAELVLFSIEN